MIIPQISLSHNIKVQSIISLEKSIPYECGLRIFLEDEKIEMITKIIKKNRKTFTYFKTTSLNKKIDFADIIADDLSVVKLINQPAVVGKNNISYQGDVDTDSTANFFQKLIVSGGRILFNSRTFKINGPIESKVRLEYLFCTGEMFHPKYEK